MRIQTILLGGLMASLIASTSTLAAAPLARVIGHIPAPGDTGWDYASFDPVSRTIYVTRGTSLMSLDVDSGVVKSDISITKRAHEALPINGGAELLVTDSGDGTAKIINSSTGALRVSVKTSAGPDAAVFEPTTGLVFVMGNQSGIVDLIDPKAGVAMGAIVVGGKLEFAVADGKGHVFVNVEDRNELAMLDAGAKTVSARFKLDGCEEPSGLAYISPGDVLLSACGNGVAAVVSPTSGKVIALLPIGRNPDAALFDPVHNLGYVPAGDGTLTVIAFDGQSARVVQTVATAKGARLGAVDPKTGKVYLPAAKYGLPATPGGRAPMTPGSFELIVVGP